MDTHSSHKGFQRKNSIIFRSQYKNFPNAVKLFHLWFILLLEKKNTCIPHFHVNLGYAASVH